MTGQPLRIAVLGAGLVGGYMGGKLAAAGARVILIGRGRQLAIFREHGVRVSELDGGDIEVPASNLSLTNDPARSREAELILVCVKSAATADAARQIAPYIPPATPVLTLQNGVTNTESLRAELPGRVVLAGMVSFNVVQPAAGRLHRATGGGVFLQRHPALDPFAALFSASGLHLHWSDDMPSVLWGKLLINLNNAINALSGLPLGAQLAQRDYRHALAACQLEALAVLERARVKPMQIMAIPPEKLPEVFSLPDEEFNSFMQRGGASKIDANARSSMAEDIAAGRRTEVDYLNGAVVALAERVGFPAPANRRIVELVRLAEQGAPPCPAARLLEEINLAR